MEVIKMAAETNLIKKEDLVRAREIEFVTLFGESIKKLVEALGVTRKIPKQAKWYGVKRLAILYKRYI